MYQHKIYYTHRDTPDVKVYSKNTQLFTLEEFRQAIAASLLNTCDTGVPVLNDNADMTCKLTTENAHKIPVDATHILWVDTRAQHEMFTKQQKQTTTEGTTLMPLCAKHFQAGDCPYCAGTEDKLQKLHIQRCALCNTQTMFSFDPLPENQPKSYCLECAILIAEFPTKFNIHRFDVRALRRQKTGERPGRLSDTCNFMFMRGSMKSSWPFIREENQ